MNVSFLRLRESSGWRMLWAPGMRRRRPARELRLAVDCLPLQTRKAMLQGIDANRIIVGAYTDRQGGVCPMLAAHRNGGRTSPPGLGPALGGVERPRRQRRPTGERHRARELKHQPGWGWMRPFRRLDEYEKALSELAVARSDELDLRHDAVGGRS